MKVIGTAGHVDHGKSSLVKALTGIDPDRLQEEKDREMTIDLGFAWLELPSGQWASIVDVPGHEDFIKNMLAGVGGIDVAMFVVAADEGVMPQTREHLAILDLLEVRSSVIVLTKQDLIDDPEWLQLVQEDVREQVAGTCLENAPIIPVSARTRYGLDQLKAELDRIIADSPPRRDINRPRLPIDRIFSLAGFGTVVTGTLIDGRLAVGQEVDILPSGLRSRIRGLQTHKHKLEEASPGSRVAVNLVGLSVDELRRGEVVCHANTMKPTALVDVTLRYLEGAAKPLRHNAEVDFYVGASVVPARVRLLGVDELTPGEHGWAQIVLAEPVVTAKGDRYVIRQPSPSQTIGGGSIVDPLPARRHRRFRPEVVERLETLTKGTPEEIVLQALERQQPLEAGELLKLAHMPAEMAQEGLAKLIEEGQIVALAATGAAAAEVASSNRYLFTRSGWGALADKAAEMLFGYHRANPLRGGMPRNELRNRLRLTNTRLFGDVLAQLAAQGALAETASGDIRLPDHEIRFTPQQQARVSELLREFTANPYSPPSAASSEERVGADVLNALLEQRKLVKVSDEVIFAAATYDAMVARIVEHLKSNSTITLAQVRDLFGTSRKYAGALLEYLDAQHVTRRIGDERVLRAG